MASGSADMSVKIFSTELKQEIHHFKDIHLGKNIRVI